MQAGQASSAAWQAEVAMRMENTDKIIAQPQSNLHKESPRKQPRTTDHMDTDGYSTPVGESSTGPPPSFTPAAPARQVSFSPFGSANPSSSAQRSTRSGSAPPPVPQPGTEDDEHLILIRLPEPVHEKHVHPWWTATSKHFPVGLTPKEVVILPFHDYVTFYWESAQCCTRAALFLRGLKQTLKTRGGTEQNIIIIIRDRPPQIQRRARGIHPYCKVLLECALKKGEEIRPLHRGRGRIPYATFHGVHTGTRDACLLLTTLRWKDTDPDAHMITITEVLTDDALAEDVKLKLRNARSL